MVQWVEMPATKPEDPHSTLVKEKRPEVVL